LQQLRSRLALSGYPLSKQQLKTVSPGPVKLTARLERNSLEIQNISSDPTLPFSTVRHWKIEGFAETYHQQWPETGLVRATKASDQLMQFELNLDEKGNATIQRLDPQKLPRGATTTQRNSDRSQPYQGNRTSRTNSSNSTGSTGNGRGHR
jgi:hypothetical protein